MTSTTIAKRIAYFEISLERSDILSDDAVQYAPGDVVRGNVRLKLNQSLQILNFGLNIRGTGNVRLQADEGQQRFGNEIYLDEHAKFIGSNEEDKVVTLDKGDHIFPFECDLPDNLPSTCVVEDFGSVSYHITCVLHLVSTSGLPLAPMTKSETFIVKRQLPLNPHFNFAYKEVIKQRFPLNVKERLQCRFSAIKAHVLLSRRSFQQGEAIHLAASIVNGSNKIVTDLCCALVATFSEFSEPTRQIYFKMICDRQDIYEIHHMKGRKWRNVQLTIPSLVPNSGIVGSKLVNVSYDVVFKIGILLELPVVKRIPILIGTELPPDLVATSRPVSTLGTARSIIEFSSFHPAMSNDFSYENLQNSEYVTINADIHDGNQRNKKKNPLFQADKSETELIYTLNKRRDSLVTTEQHSLQFSANIVEQSDVYEDGDFVFINMC